MDERPEVWITVQRPNWCIGSMMHAILTAAGKEPAYFEWARRAEGKTWPERLAVASEYVRFR